MSDPTHPPRSSDVPDARPGGAPRPASAVPVRVVLADRHRVLRSGISLLLRGAGDMSVVAEAGTVDAALRAVRDHRPDVLVLGLVMPGALLPLDALPAVAEHSPTTAVVVLTSHEEPEHARRALAAGALGYVLKEAGPEELIESIRRAAVGQTYLSPALGVALVAAPRRESPADGLSERELSVLRLLAIGFTNAEVGAQLSLSGRTIESHRARLQLKLGRSTRAELVRYAYDRGLLDWDAASAGAGRTDH